MPKTLDFQRRLLSACYIKQNWLFLKLVERYADFAIQLTQIDRSLNEPFIVDTFRFDKFKETSLIPNDYPQRIVAIRNRSSLHFFAMANLKILIHAISLPVNSYRSYEKLVKWCTEAALRSFDVMDFKIKTLALQFLLEVTIHCSVDYCRPVTQLLLRSFIAINSRIDYWNVTDSVNEFDGTLSQFLDNDKIVSSFCEVTDDCAKIFDFCLALTERRRRIGSANYQRLIATSHRRLRCILKTHLTPSLGGKVYEFVFKAQGLTRESLDLLECCVLEECKAAGAAYVWHVGCEQAEEILCQCYSCDHVDKIRGKGQRSEASENALIERHFFALPEQFDLFRHLLEIALRVRHNFIAWHQNQHLTIQAGDFQCKTCSGSSESSTETISLPNRVVKMKVVQPTLMNNIEKLSSLFVNLLKKFKCLSRLDVSNASISLLSFMGPNATDEHATHLLSLAMCLYPCYDTLKEFNFEFSNCTATRDDQIRTLQRFFHAEIPLTRQMTDVVFEMLMEEKLLPDMCVSLMIRSATEGYNRNDLLRHLFDEQMLNDPLYALSLSEHIVSLVCLSAHNCNCDAVWDSEKGYQYSVFCNSCKSANIDRRSEKGTTLGIVSPIPFAENDTLSDRHVECILKMLQSSQLPVRLNVVQCLPALCCRHSHLLCSTGSLHWTNIFTDNDLALNYQFLKVIPRIVDGINVNYLPRSPLNQPWLTFTLPFRCSIPIWISSSKIVQCNRVWRNS